MWHGNCSKTDRQAAELNLATKFCSYPQRSSDQPQPTSALHGCLQGAASAKGHLSVLRPFVWKAAGGIRSQHRPQPLKQVRKQVVLPTRHKGFGLRQSSRLAALSFVTSVLRFRASGAPLFGASGFTAQSLHDLADRLQHLSLGMPATAHQAWAWPRIRSV